MGCKVNKYIDSPMNAKSVDTGESSHKVHSKNINSSKVNKALGLSHNGRGCFGSRFGKPGRLGLFTIQFKCEGISLVLFGYWENMGSSGILPLIFHSYDDFWNGLVLSRATF